MNEVFLTYGYMLGNTFFAEQIIATANYNIFSKSINFQNFNHR